MLNQLFLFIPDINCFCLNMTFSLYFICIYLIKTIQRYLYDLLFYIKYVKTYLHMKYINKNYKFFYQKLILVNFNTNIIHIFYHSNDVTDTIKVSDVHTNCITAGTLNRAIKRTLAKQLSIISRRPKSDDNA